MWISIVVMLWLFIIYYNEFITNLVKIIKDVIVGITYIIAFIIRIVIKIKKWIINK